MIRVTVSVRKHMQGWGKNHSSAVNNLLCCRKALAISPASGPIRGSEVKRACDSGSPWFGSCLCLEFIGGSRYYLLFMCFFDFITRLSPPHRRAQGELHYLLGLPHHVNTNNNTFISQPEPKFIHTILQASSKAGGMSKE